ncbi:alpha/beta hydrolase [Saccharomonospora viridis]|uniref:Esterase/lipase n=1 Tax=Saccharomonospora viridis (strain ATCC 15386 / DSM 43017 / JCM 3036 / CCUG 5913 / NBRC 12207 / NCIMB 9602 / P101) TaxID=471857 RepID=C7MQC3_SACVD|nr:alpha/beta hydrolase [Saccharomonospora viridis]ACU96422.1 esterase/lipase [Saccharomonospora viridis DSM 43017]
MKPEPAPAEPGRLRTGLGRAALALSALSAVALVAAAALVLLPPPSYDVWQLALLVLEFALVPAGVALAGTALAVLALRWTTWRRTSTVVAGLNAVALVAALVPPVALWNTARHHDVSLSLPDYVAGLAVDTDRAPETVRYATVDGEDLMLDVWRPGKPGTGEPLPVVINVHGGAEDYPQSMFPRWDTWLADQGYVVFDIDYRFFPHGDWQAAPGDVKCAVSWVRRHAKDYGADPDRIALMGQSAGGLLTLLASYSTDEQIPSSCPEHRESTDVQAAIAWYTATDATEAAVLPWRLRHSAEIGPDLEQQQERMTGAVAGTEQARRLNRALSPITYVDAQAPPTLLIQAGHDVFVSPEDIRAFADRLERAGVTHRVLSLPWTEHMFDLNWGGFASQITREVLARFLAERL